VISYNVGADPTEKGVYACRIPFYAEDGREIGSLQDDKFLVWDGGWYHRMSDQSYRGEVIGWIGPLQRRVEREPL
jgi:hypothetical protein